jgi:hypothetical protein
VRSRIALTLLAAAAAAVAFGAGTARAAGGGYLFHDVASSTSSNWSGYAVTGPTAFSSVTGSWTQPAVTCTRGSAAYSAFWVGLGGFAASSQALEQIGTEADCTASASARYSAWYELVPAPSVPVSLAVRPGDAMTATVTVAGTSVTMTLANATTGQSFTKTATVASPDVSSAEWIAEAPSSCNASGSRCQTLPLANFGTVSFSGVSATGDGVAGTPTTSAWSASAIALRGSSGVGLGRSRFGAAQGSVTATPGSLATDGSTFAGTWAQQSVAGVRPGRGGRGWWGWGWGR